MVEGRITRIVADRRFFFIDDDFWCHYNNYDRIPEETHIVEYTPEIKSDGKKNANNVRYLRTAKNPFDEYLEEVESGYFNESGSIDKEFLLDYPKFLVNDFKSKSNVNNPTQIKKFFVNIRLIESNLKFSGDFEKAKSELYSLVSLAYNAYSKNKISENYYRFFEKNIISACQDEKSFVEGFVPHFQSIIGFFGE